MNLDDKIRELRKEYAKDESPLNEHIAADDRSSAKRRHIAYRCRKLLRDVGENDPENDLSNDQMVALDALADAEFSGWKFEAIETLYSEIESRDVKRIELDDIEQAINQNSIYQIEDLKMSKPLERRRKIIWDILWGIVTVFEELNLTDDFHRTLIKENVERRLWKIERMRYNVSRDLKGTAVSERVLDGPVLDRSDGHILRMFEYPSSLEYPGMSAKTYDVRMGGNSRDFWDRKTGGLTGEFVINDNGKNSPIKAIQAIFEPKDAAKGWKSIEDRTVNYCDRVLHILHLDELAAHLMRINDTDIGRADEALKEQIEKCPNIVERVGIVTGNRYPGAIGSGQSASGCEQGDPYFEYIEIRLDELIPGDHVALRNHPAYQGLCKGDFRLENALVTGFKGSGIPAHIEVQGHGLGPHNFFLFQTILIYGFQTALKYAQKDVSSDAMVLDWAKTASTIIEGAEYRIPFILGVDNVPSEATIEFRNEFEERDLGAFWARWIYKVSYVGVNREYENDVTAFPGPVKMPFVDEIDIDVNEKMLTLKGTDLTEDRIEAVYFVSDPRRSLDENGNWQVPSSGSFDFLVVNGNFEVSARDPDKVIFPGEQEEKYGKEIKVNIDSFEPQLRYQNWPYYWRPVIRTPLRIEIMPETSFKWPPVDTIPPSPGIYMFRGYNVAYFPLFEKLDSQGSYDKAVYVDNVELLTSLVVLSFYRHTAPGGKVNVLRPRLVDIVE